MRITDVRTGKQLTDFMTTPTDGLVEFARNLEGDLLVLGAGGKMGPDLLETVARADRLAGARRRLAAADLGYEDSLKTRLLGLGVSLHVGDLTEREFLRSLPDAPNIVYMAGTKFGTSKDWRKTFHLNCILPYLVGERYPEAGIVVFSSGNPYPHTLPAQGGCREGDELAPHGVYGWSIVARESAFSTTALKLKTQRFCFFRLMYAQHLAYGVLVDLARMVWSDEPVSLEMPAVNLISQRDAVDVAIRALGHCANPPFILNCAGPITRVRDIVGKIARQMGKEPKFAGTEAGKALVANDDLCRKTFGGHRDGVEEMIQAAADWVMRGGETWGKPTMFGKLGGGY